MAQRRRRRHEAGRNSTIRALRKNGGCACRHAARNAHRAETMKDPALQPDEIQKWFERAHGEDNAIVLVRVTEETAAAWATDLVDGARRCYVSDDFLERRATEIGVTKTELLSAVLPDPGPVPATSARSSRFYSSLQPSIPLM